MKNVSDSIKQVMVVFLFCFVALISYIAYFQFFTAPNIAAQEGNQRLAAERNKVLRGTIYDRDKNALTTSERGNALTQKRGYTNGELYVHPLGYASSVYGFSGLEKAFLGICTIFTALKLVFIVLQVGEICIMHSFKIFNYTFDNIIKIKQNY